MIPPQYKEVEEQYSLQSNPGTTNAKIAFNYNTEGDKQDSTTKSFTFEILP